MSVSGLQTCTYTQMHSEREGQREKGKDGGERERGRGKEIVMYASL